jgi:hypothetical protein
MCFIDPTFYKLCIVAASEKSVRTPQVQLPLVGGPPGTATRRDDPQPTIIPDDLTTIPTPARRPSDESV